MKFTAIPFGTQEEGALRSKKSPVRNSSEGQIGNLDDGHQNSDQKSKNDTIISDSLHQTLIPQRKLL